MVEKLSMKANLGAGWSVGLLMPIYVILFQFFCPIYLYSIKKKYLSVYSNGIIRTFHVICLRPQDLGYFGTFDISLV